MNILYFKVLDLMDYFDSHNMNSLDFSFSNNFTVSLCLNCARPRLLVGNTYLLPNITLYNLT